MCAKGSADLARGKPHDLIDLGLSAISVKRRRWRIDIYAEECTYQIKVSQKKHVVIIGNRFYITFSFPFTSKVKSREEFERWLDALEDHRQFRQQQLRSGDSTQMMVSSPAPAESLNGSTKSVKMGNASHDPGFRLALLFTYRSEVTFIDL